MKRNRSVLAFAALLVLGAFSSVSAQERSEKAWWGSYYMPGNLSASVFAGGSSYPSVGIYPQAEIFLFKAHLWGLFPMDIAAAGIGSLQAGFGDPGYASAGAGAMATFHFGFRGTGLETFEGYLDRADYFFGLGLGYDAASDEAYRSGLQFISNSGIRYFLDDQLALSLAWQYWGGSNFTLGATWKIGPKEEIDETRRPMAALKENLALTQFQALYLSQLAYGGYAFDDSGFKDGSSVVWKTVSVDGTDGKGKKTEWTVERALLKTLADGSKWWKFRFESDGDILVYEFLAGKDGMLAKLRHRASPDAKVEEITPDAEAWGGNLTAWNEEGWKPFEKGSETVKVAAGSFTTSALKLQDKDSATSYSWWVSKDVPGYLVKMSLKDADSSVEGELVAIRANARTELGSF
ncbi:MAG: hypothetical protein A2Z99_00810 [Treponema sp. GWB1_62_6]|nr:MAG: hypothetical protein A2Y36_17685 [Treponema sp. GWA1_62_8]OHE66655.1 MAG: hypothetical protein A2Z99_00810 [Treponema sp. GWB1_62_6]OHE66798.1 MAG: hypothetical protein A2001_13445 [Treponema sp. GWC1_61_84]OHE75367.1 MAG: hypothetical protein A2413_12665 [Treponema sp. RIFOXYC1_FULL_61_9]HCM27220.1 hypothetical protein [Treponema sp.]